MTKVLIKSSFVTIISKLSRGKYIENKKEWSAKVIELVVFSRVQIEAVYANMEGLYSLYKEVLEELLVLLYNELENESKIAEIEILKKYQVETILNHYSDMGKQKKYLSL